MTITNPSEIENLTLDANIAPEGAYPTSRVIPGLHGANQQEWAEEMTLSDGRSATRFWIFDNEDCKDAEGEYLEADLYPWDQKADRLVIDEA